MTKKVTLYKAQTTVDEFDFLNHPICCTFVCVCEGKTKQVKSLEDYKLIQFLMGLNDVYG